MNKRTPFASALASLNPLPSPRGASLHMVRMAQKSDVSIEELVRVARSDPALCGRLIHAANRLRVDVWSPTGALEVAVQRLGFAATRQIALGFSIVGEHLTGHCSAFDYDHFWTASLWRGVAAQALSARIGRAASSDTFVLGLLLDVGRLAFATAQPAAYSALLEKGHPEGARLRGAERECFGIDHGELGALLLEQWMLPSQAVAAVRDFHDESGTPVTATRQTLFLADAIARAALAPADVAPAWTHVALKAATSCGLDAASLNEIARTVAAEAAQWGPLLRLPVPRIAQQDFERYGEPHADGADARPLRILLVDDEEDEHLLLRLVLEAHGYCVSAANSADAALEAIFDAPPDMVITDWQMPGMSGPELCHALRKTRIGENLHLIIRTGRERKEDLVEGINAGANDFISKNSAESVLLARVQAGARAALQAVSRTAQLARVTRRAGDLAVLGLT